MLKYLLFVVGTLTAVLDASAGLIIDETCNLSVNLGFILDPDLLEERAFVQSRGYTLIIPLKLEPYVGLKWLGYDVFNPWIEVIYVEYNDDREGADLVAKLLWEGKLENIPFCRKRDTQNLQ